MAVDQVNIFWQEVATAYKQVAATHELKVEVSRNGKSATVFYEPIGDSIVIMVSEVKTETKEALIAP